MIVGCLDEHLFYSIVKSQTIEVLTIVVNMERPVGLLSEEPLHIGSSVRIRLHKDNRRRSRVRGLFLLIEIVPSVHPVPG